MSQPAKMTPRAAALLVLLIILGYLGNYFKLTLFFGADYIFGSIAVLMVLALYGLGWGTLAAVVAGAQTFFLWGHAYSCITFTLEALFVGIMLRRGRRNLILADGLFWLLLGMPSVWVFFHLVMQMDVTITVFIMLKQSVNGIFNALLAGLALNHLPLPRRWAWAPDPGKISLKETLFNLLVALVLFPALLITMLDTRHEVSRMESNVAAQMQALSGDIAQVLRHWHGRYLHAVTELASLAGQSGVTPGPQLQHDTEIITKAFPDFHAMYVADAGGTTIAFYPKINEKGESTLGLNFADRPYYQALLAQKRPVLSEVFQGRGGVFSPIVCLAVPVVREERFLGFALGALDLQRLQTFLESFRKEPGQHLTLTDPQGRIIAGTDPHRAAMQVWNPRTGGQIRPLGASVYHRLPDDPALPTMTRWKKSYYVQDTVIAADLPWRLTLETPVAPLQQRLYFIYVRNLGTMLGLVAPALLLALIISRWMARPLGRLAMVTTDLPDKLSELQSLNWPQSSAAEIHSLISNSQAMARTMEKIFQELKERSRELARTNRELQVEINERALAEEALRRSETLLRQVFNAIPDLLTVHDRDLNIILSNWQGHDYVPPAARAGRPKCYAAYMDRDKPCEPCHALEVLETGQPLSLEHTNPVDGLTREINVFPVLDDAGQVIMVAEYVRDVTERRRAEAEKAKLEAQLLQAQKLEAIGTLAGGIAHDFNNILYAILGNTELALLALEQEPNAARFKTNLEEVLQAGKRAQDLVQQILTFSRRGEQEIMPVQVRLIVEETLKLLRASLPSTIEIRPDLDPQSGFVLGDAGRIHQVVMNLCTNAYQAMQPAGGVLEVRLAEVAVEAEPAGTQTPLPPGAYLKLTVNDTGRGIKPEIRERIFDPYFTTKPPGAGTGLGLSVVHGIVAGLKGAIVFQSREEGGTSFQVFLPRFDPGAPPPVAPLASLPRGHEHILFVDDEQAIAHIGKRLLEHFGYRVTAHTDSLAALAAFRAQPQQFDLVITDLTMPQMTGVELAREMLRLRPELPIILCTGYSETVLSEKSKETGFREYLLKPVVARDLAQAIRRALDQDKPPG